MSKRHIGSCFDNFLDGEGCLEEVQVTATKRVAAWQQAREPNAETIAAIKELESGEGKSFASVEALMADLNSEDE